MKLEPIFYAGYNMLRSESTGVVILHKQQVMGPGTGYHGGIILELNPTIVLSYRKNRFEFISAQARFSADDCRTIVEGLFLSLGCPVVYNPTFMSWEFAGEKSRFMMSLSLGTLLT